jgi:hypothetical protein
VAAARRSRRTVVSWRLTARLSQVNASLAVADF